jgi:hypothetical protein
MKVVRTIQALIVETDQVEEPDGSYPARSSLREQQVPPHASSAFIRISPE